MKKSCRVYKPKLTHGGPVSNITQDSTIDPISEARTNYFIDWLKSTSDQAQIKNALENANLNPAGMMRPQAIPMAQSGIQQPPVDIFFPDNAVYTEGLNFEMPYSDSRGIQDEVRRQQEYFNNNVQFQAPPTAPEPLDYGMPGGTEVNMEGIETPSMFFTEPGENAPDVPPEYQLDWSRSDRRMLENMPDEAGALDESNEEYVAEPNYYAIGQGITTGLNALAWLGEADERAAERRRVEERTSNVHRLYSPDKRTNRGDYLQNTKREGEYFRPDQHTRFGYNTKTAQDGMEVNDEVELTEDEIRALINQGYQFDYID